MDHRFGAGERLRRFLVSCVRRTSSPVFTANLDWNRHRRGHIDGNIVLGSRRRAWRDRDSSQAPSVGLGRETITKTPLTRRRVGVSDSPTLKRHGDSVSGVEGYKSPISAMLVVSPPATMM
jgi:hypothetical protein